MQITVRAEPQHDDIVIPSDVLRLIPGTEPFLGLGFHSSRVYCAERTDILDLA